MARPILLPLSEKYIQRFFARTVAQSDECWIWQFSKDKDGYGQFCVCGSQRKAHRISWLIHRGEIPAGMHVLHNCPNGDNRACVNPAHLWLGTHEENVADMNSKGRGAYKLTVSQVKQAKKERKKYGWPYTYLGKKYKVTSSAIRRAIVGESLPRKFT